MAQHAAPAEAMAIGKRQTRFKRGGVGGATTPSDIAKHLCRARHAAPLRNRICGLSTYTRQSHSARVGYFSFKPASTPLRPTLKSDGWSAQNQLAASLTSPAPLYFAC